MAGEAAHPGSMAVEAEHWASLGQAFRELGQYDDAVAAFRRALDLAPADADTWHRLGVVLLLLQRDDEAIVAFRRALAVDPAESRARFNLATLIRRETATEAALHLAVLWRHDPDLALLLQTQLCIGRSR